MVAAVRQHAGVGWINKEKRERERKRENRPFKTSWQESRGERKRNVEGRLFKYNDRAIRRRHEEWENIAKRCETAERYVKDREENITPAGPPKRCEMSFITRWSPRCTETKALFPSSHRNTITHSTALFSSNHHPPPSHPLSPLSVSVRKRARSSSTRTARRSYLFNKKKARERNTVKKKKRSATYRFTGMSTYFWRTEPLWILGVGKKKAAQVESNSKPMRGQSWSGPGHGCFYHVMIPLTGPLQLPFFFFSQSLSLSLQCRSGYKFVMWLPQSVNSPHKSSALTEPTATFIKHPIITSFRVILLNVKLQFVKKV